MRGKGKSKWLGVATEQPTGSEDPLHSGGDEGEVNAMDFIYENPLTFDENHIYIPVFLVHIAQEFAFNASTAHEPKSWTKAMSRPDAHLWMKAAEDEIDALIRNGTWDVVELPTGRKAIGS